MPARRLLGSGSVRVKDLSGFANRCLWTVLGAVLVVVQAVIALFAGLGVYAAVRADGQKLPTVLV